MEKREEPLKLRDVVNINQTFIKSLSKDERKTIGKALVQDIVMWSCNGYNEAIGTLEILKLHFASMAIENEPFRKTEEEPKETETVKRFAGRIT